MHSREVKCFAKWKAGVHRFSCFLNFSLCHCCFSFNPSNRLHLMGSWPALIWLDFRIVARSYSVNTPQSFEALFDSFDIDRLCTSFICQKTGNSSWTTWDFAKYSRQNTHANRMKRCGSWPQDFRRVALLNYALVLSVTRCCSVLRLLVLPGQRFPSPMAYPMAFANLWQLDEEPPGFLKAQFQLGRCLYFVVAPMHGGVFKESFYCFFNRHCYYFIIILLFRLLVLLSTIWR